MPAAAHGAGGRKPQRGKQASVYQGFGSTADGAEAAAASTTSARPGNKPQRGKQASVYEGFNGETDAAAAAPTSASSARPGNKPQRGKQASVYEGFDRETTSADAGDASNSAGKSRKQRPSYMAATLGGVAESLDEEPDGAAKARPSRVRQDDGVPAQAPRTEDGDGVQKDQARSARPSYVQATASATATGPAPDEAGHGGGVQHQSPREHAQTPTPLPEQQQHEAADSTLALATTLNSFAGGDTQRESVLWPTDVEVSTNSDGPGLAEEQGSMPNGGGGSGATENAARNKGREKEARAKQRRSRTVGPDAPLCDRACCVCCEDLTCCTPDGYRGRHDREADEVPEHVAKEHADVFGSFWCNRTVLQIVRCFASVALIVLYMIITYYTSKLTVHHTHTRARACACSVRLSFQTAVRRSLRHRCAAALL